jgi:hypothetical protein
MHHVVCVLGNIVADNIGLHGIFGYTKSFSHSSPCDLCIGDSEKFQCEFQENKFKLRDEELYNLHCQQLQKQMGPKSHVWGLKSISSFSKLNYYHPVHNDTCDIMHDILEGIAPFEVNLLLRELIVKRKLLHTDELNRMLNCFEYGSIMQSSKPS